MAVTFIFLFSFFFFIFFLRMRYRERRGDRMFALRISELHASWGRIWRVRRSSGTGKSCWQTRASEIRHHLSSELFVRRAVSGVWLFKELSRDVLWFPVPETFAYPSADEKEKRYIDEQF